MNRPPHSPTPVGVPKILLNSNNNSYSSASASPQGRGGPTVKLPPSQLHSAQNTRPTSPEGMTTYRDINLDPSNLDLIPCQNLRPGVSFDTVAISYSRDGREDYLLSSDSGTDDDDDGFNDLRSVSPFANGRSPSPAVSQMFFNGCDIDNRSKEPQRFDSRGFRVDYPTSSAVTKDSFVLTSQHLDYMQYTENKPSRTLLVYITGRRHTWVGLDYALDKLLRNGDHLVVISRVPSSFKDELPHSQNCSDEVDPHVFCNAARRIERYIKFIAPPETNFKLTIDLYLSHSTIPVINEASSIYNPHVMVVSQKPNMRFSQDQHSWSTSRMSARLFKKIYIPLIIVSSMKMNEFEIRLFEKLGKKNEWTMTNMDELRQKLRELEANETSLANIEAVIRTNLKVDDDNGSDSDDSSIVSIDSEDAVEDLVRTVSEFRQQISSYIRQTNAEEINERTFIDRLNKLSDITSEVGSRFQAASRFEKGDEVVRTLTGMPKLEKHKSMLDVLEPTDSNKVRKLKTQLSSTHDTLRTPAPRTIKFQNSNSGVRGKSHEQLSDLRKIKSSVETTYNAGAREITLLPSISHQGLTKSVSESKVPVLEKTKGKSFLKKLFGGK